MIKSWSFPGKSFTDLLSNDINKEEAAFFPPHNESAGRSGKERSAIGDDSSRGQGQAGEAKDSLSRPVLPPGRCGEGPEGRAGHCPASS